MRTGCRSSGKPVCVSVRPSLRPAILKSERRWALPSARDEFCEMSFFAAYRGQLRAPSEGLLRAYDGGVLLIEQVFAATLVAFGGRGCIILDNHHTVGTQRGAAPREQPDHVRIRQVS